MSIDGYPPKSFDNFVVVTSGTRPSLPWEGMEIYETDTKRIYIWNGSAWVRIGGRPSSFLGAIDGATTSGTTPTRMGILNVAAQPFACRVRVQSLFLATLGTMDGSEFEFSLRDGANYVDGYFSMNRVIASGPTKQSCWLMSLSDNLVAANTAKTYTLWAVRLGGASTVNVPADGRYCHIGADYWPDQPF